MKILDNARIYTMNPAQPVASTLAIHDGRIVGVGNSVDEIVPPGYRITEKINLQGQTVLPGLTDSHLHFELYALSLQDVNGETETRAECVRRVAERAQKTPPGQWITGHGWNHNRWTEGYGNAGDLDHAAPHNPVYLVNKSVHSAWANSAALCVAGITSTTLDPVSGKIGRDEHGNPDGLLFESAMALVERVIPAQDEAQLAQHLDDAQSSLWRMGLTGLHDFDRQRCFVGLQTLRQRGKLHLRVLKSLPLEDLEKAARLGLRGGFGDDLLHIGAVKVFMDGALGPQTAAMLEPYENKGEDQRGMIFFTAEQLFEHGKLAVDNGLSLAVHAIGDRANREVLNAFAMLRRYEQENKRPHLRHRVEHVQLIHTDDLARLAQYDLIASVQPIHATSDMVMAEQHWGARCASAYAYRSLIDSGAKVVFGSDAPVESPNPFLGIHAAVTRRRANGDPGPQGWRSEQSVLVQQALSAYTTMAAYAAGMEDCLGQIKPGYHADLITLTQDPLTLSEHDLQYLTVHATMVGGEWVYHSDHPDR